MCIYVRACAYIHITSTRPGRPYYYLEVCREFQSVMFQLQSLSFISESFMSPLNQEIGKFTRYNKNEVM